MQRLFYVAQSYLRNLCANTNFPTNVLYVQGTKKHTQVGTGNYYGKKKRYDLRLRSRGSTVWHMKIPPSSLLRPLQSLCPQQPQRHSAPRCQAVCRAPRAACVICSRQAAPTQHRHSSPSKQLEWTVPNRVAQTTSKHKAGVARGAPEHQPRSNGAAAAPHSDEPRAAPTMRWLPGLTGWNTATPTCPLGTCTISP